MSIFKLLFIFNSRFLGSSSLFRSLSFIALAIHVVPTRWGLLFVLSLSSFWVLASSSESHGGPRCQWEIPRSSSFQAGMGSLCFTSLLCTFYIRSLSRISALPDAVTLRYSFFSFYPSGHIVIWYTQRALSSTLSYRWRSLALSSPFFSAPWLSLSCIGWMANVVKDVFLLVPKSTLWLETFFQCLAHSNGRLMPNGDKITVRDRSRLWSPASNFLCRFRYYSCERFRDIYDYLKFVRSRHRPSRPKI